MPLVLIAAVVGSLGLHALALFGTNIDLSGPPETTVLQAELKPLPEAPAPAAPARPKPRPKAPKPAPEPLPAPSPEAASEAQAAPEIDEKTPSTVQAVPVTPPVPPAPVAVQPVLPGSGVIRYSIVKVSLGLTVGRAEQRWEFREDGTYRLQSVTETTGLAALLRPSRIEQESTGRLAPNGLQPETFRVRKNGADTGENADFDWSTVQVRLAREDAPRAVARNAQDLLSLQFQLAYLKRPENGASIGVVTGKKYERYDLDALGEEEIDTPLGRLRTLHLRAQTDNITEFWIAPDKRNLVVRLRFTDRKGDAFEQNVTEIGMP